MTVSICDLRMNKAAALVLHQHSATGNSLNQLEHIYKKVFKGSTNAFNHFKGEIASLLWEAAETPLEKPVTLDMLVDSPFFNQFIKNDIEPQQDDNTLSREDFVNKNYLTKRSLSDSSLVNNSSDNNYKTNDELSKNQNPKLLHNSKSTDHHRNGKQRVSPCYRDLLECLNFEALELLSNSDFDDESGYHDESVITSNLTTPTSDSRLPCSMPETPASTSVLNLEKDRSCSQKPALMKHSLSMDNIVEHASSGIVASNIEVKPIVAHFSTDPHFISSHSYVKKSKNRLIDSDTVAKRVKHNSMEKLRRKHVTTAFYKLAELLNLTDGKSKKPSKANILISATHAAHQYNKVLADLKLSCDAIHTNRINLLSKISSCINLH